MSPELLSWDDAYDAVWSPLVLARGVIDLVHTAESTGMMTALREPCSPGVLKQVTGLPEVALAPLLEALEVNGIVTRAAGTYRLTEPWLVLTGEAATTPLATVLASSDVERAVLRGWAPTTTGR